MPREVFILKSGKCSWGGCVFCGYGRIIGEVLDNSVLEGRFDDFFPKLGSGVDEVCVYGSGSFLDEAQVPVESRRYFVEKCLSAGIRKLTVESRPEYVTEKALADFRGLELTVAFGLEVADDRVLARLKKGFRLADFEEAAGRARESDCRVRAYLLVNPPYVTDIRKSLAKSVEYALEHADSVVVINTLPHANSPLFDLWVSGEWNFLAREDFAGLTAAWRDNPRVEFDAETFRFTPRFPARLRGNLAGVGEEYLTHPYFEVWQDWLTRWYAPPQNKKTLLFLPCAYKKPYSESETHQAIIKALEKTGMRAGIHEVMLSNAGVIPREFEDEYPFNAYDWNEKLETPEIKERYIQVTEDRIRKYVTAHEKHYNKILCYLKYDSESYNALEKAAPEAVNLLTKQTYNKIKDWNKPLTQEDALRELESGIKK
ncbi:MAG: DUF5591 domain-containing protein [Candidatus Altiarchaeota archaeon]